VALKQPFTLDQVVVFAGAYEQCTLVVVVPTQSWTSVVNLGPDTMGSVSAPSSIKLPPTKKLMSAEIVDRHKKNQCFHCDNNLTLGHKDVCKQMFIIEVIDDGDNLRMSWSYEGEGEMSWLTFYAGVGARWKQINDRCPIWNAFRFCP
jgi:hypothetical protein